MHETKLAAMNARALAAVAEKLAYDLEAGRLWPDDYTTALSLLRGYLNDMPGRIPG